MSLAGRRRRPGWRAGADAAGGAALLFVAAASLWSLVKLFL